MEKRRQQFHVRPNSGWLLLAVLLTLVISFLAPAADSAGPAPLKAGVGKALIDPELGMPLAGYGDRMGKGNQGVHDHVYARALLMESDATRVGFVNADILLITRELRQKLLSRVSDLDIDFLAVTATHTHSSIGGYVDNTMYKIAVMGPYHERAEQIVLDGMEAALRQAVSNLAPAAVGSATGKAPGVSANRRHLGGPTDPTMRVFAVWNKEGEPVAVIMNHAIHPTAMGGDNLLASGDFAGRAESLIEERYPGAVAMYMNSGLGDQRPGEDHLDGWDRVESVGRKVADRAIEIIESIKPADMVELDPLVHPFKMPEAQLNPSYSCWYGLNPLVERLGREMIREQGELMAVGVNNDTLMFVSGEISYDVQAAIAANVPGDNILVVSHANDYWGYVLTAEDYETGGYESCMNFYGSGLGPLLVEETGKMFAGHRKCGGCQPDCPCKQAHAE